jgi:integrase/recombinase XerD
MSTFEIVQAVETPEKAPDFALLDDFAKSDTSLADITKRIAFIVRKERLDYSTFLDVCQRVRKSAGLKRPKKQKTLPKLLSESDLRAFFKTVENCGNVEHEVMLRLLFFTAIRVNELVNIRVSDVDLGGSKIFINQGKGCKDRYILFPASFRLILSSHLQSHPKNRYLFESSRFGPYTPRRIQQIVAEYGKKAGIDRVHPHLFRHQMLTWLTKSGLTDAQIQLISGHSSKKSLEVYRHIGLDAVEASYQDAVRGVAI